ncbi:MAG TPA: tRNA pseudouridine(55) synthase TruB [Acidimicrobiia bacterium]|nr:tRNA pseudouridine(55) synthase TruB [Acidimicrobiia bacterium]
MSAGFLVVDKPGGITSHDVVAEVRRATGIRKAGHTGTLDPMATGVVVVAVGGVTRLIRFLQELDKEYVATACFGVRTDTLDADGEVLARTAMTVTKPGVEAVAASFLGETLQVPPMVSALKKDGRRLYDLAREGIEVEREARPVTIHELEILDVGTGEHPLVSFRVVCGKGTYVRALADDIARALGGYAHLTALRRTRNGTLEVSQAITVDALEHWQQYLVAPTDALSFLPQIAVDPDQEATVANGRPFASALEGLVRVVDRAGRLLAVYRGDGTTVRPEVVLA